MHDALKSFFRGKLTEAADFVTERIDMNISTDDAYEGLISGEDILQDFRNATQHMRPRGRHEVVDAWYDIREIKLYVRLNSTPKYPTFLMTGYPRKITHESKLGRALALPLQVATQWQELEMVTDKFFKMGLTTQQEVFLLPWIRDLLVEREPMFDAYRKIDVTRILRDIRIIKDRKSPDSFPAITQRINAIRRNAKQLWGQYHMLNSTDQRDLNANAVISVVRDAKLVSEIVRQELDEIATQWNTRIIERTPRYRIKA
jgi:hypothetical protein